MDIVVDIGAKQRCSQLCLNEGDLLIYRLPGGDKDNDKPLFPVYNVPEVFSKFDSLSYELAKMDLSHYQRSAVHQDMVR